jgi:hypothetical protein
MGLSLACFFTINPVNPHIIITIVLVTRYYLGLGFDGAHEESIKY